MFLQEGELLALLLAEQMTRQYLGTPLEGPLREAVRKISRYLPDEVMVQLDGVAEGFAMAGGSGLDVPLARMREVQRAIRDRRVLHVVYYSPRSNEVTERDIEPHFLVNVRGDWMAVAWDRLRGEPRTFMVARMQEAAILEKWYKPRPGLTPAEYAETTFLTEHGEQPYEVVLRFDAYLARWIRERVWHPNQTLSELEDGRLEMRLTVSGEGDLFRWVLQHGRHVEVVAPDWLRERVAGEARAVSNLYP